MKAKSQNNLKDDVSVGSHSAGNSQFNDDDEDGQMQIPELQLEQEREAIQKQILTEIQSMPITYKQINIFHLKQRGLYNEEEEQNKKNQRYQSIKDILVTDASKFPLELKISDQIQIIFDEQIIKEWENKQLFERFREVCELPIFHSMNVQIFWMILFQKFPSTCANPSVQATVKEKISQLFMELNSVISSPKEELINPGLFVMTYVCHKLMYELFFVDRKEFTLRAIMDYYHLVISEINGVLVTDYFISQSIDRFFSLRLFLDYEKSSKFTDMSQKKKKGVDRGGREFLGQKIETPIPNNKEQMKFYSDIKCILSSQKKKNSEQNIIRGNKSFRPRHAKKQSNSSNSRNSSITGSSISLSKKPTIKNGATTNPSGKTKVVDSKNHFRNGSINMRDSSSGNNKVTSLTMDSSRQVINQQQYARSGGGNSKWKKKGLKFDAKSGEDEEENEESLNNGYQNISPSLRIKNVGRDITYGRLRFNLNQVSPMIGRQLDLKDCTLQDSRKQVIFHPIDRYIKQKDYIMEVEKMKVDSSNRQKQIEINVKEQYRHQIMNSEQTRLNVLKGDNLIELPSAETLSSSTDLNQEAPASSNDLTKKLVKLRIAPKRKDEDISPAQKFKIQYQSIKEIKQFIDEKGTRVIDLPSTIQFFNKNNIYRDDEEDDNLRFINKISHNLPVEPIVEQQQIVNEKGIRTVKLQINGIQQPQSSKVFQSGSSQLPVIQQRSQSPPISAHQSIPAKPLIPNVRSIVSEKQKLDSSVNFLVREGNSTEVSPSSKMVKKNSESTKIYKEKYNNITYLTETVGQMEARAKILGKEHGFM